MTRHTRSNNMPWDELHTEDGGRTGRRCSECVKQIIPIDSLFLSICGVFPITNLLMLTERHWIIPEIHIFLIFCTFCRTLFRRRRIYLSKKDLYLWSLIGASCSQPTSEVILEISITTEVILAFLATGTSCILCLYLAFNRCNGGTCMWWSHLTRRPTPPEALVFSYIPASCLPKCITFTAQTMQFCHTWLLVKMLATNAAYKLLQLWVLLVLSYSSELCSCNTILFVSRDRFAVIILTSK